ncbi:hypothetical protein OP853_004875 [Salmonella enterica]|nr:hypothetical protein [Salmonella enterica]
MSSKLSGYGHTAGESMGGTGANMNQQHGGSSGGGVHWGGGSGHGNSGGQHSHPTGWGWTSTKNPDVPPYVDANGQVNITITNGLVKTPVYGVPDKNGHSDVHGGYIPGNPKDEVSRKWDRDNLPREFDVSVDGFKYHVTLDDHGHPVNVIRTGVRPYNHAERAKAGIWQYAYHKTQDEIYDELGFNKDEPQRQDKAKKQAEDEWNKLPPNVRSFDVNISDFHYSVKLDDYGDVLSVTRTSVRPYNHAERAKAGIWQYAYHKTQDEIYDELGFNKDEPQRQEEARKAAQDVFNSFSMNRDRVQSEVLDKTAEIITTMGDKVSEYLGEAYKTVAKEIADDIKNFQGKTIRSYGDAMASLNKILSNPGLKVYKGDKDALVNAWRQVNAQDMANKIGNLNKAFKVADLVMKVEKVREKSIEGYDTGDWGPLILEVESWVLSGIAYSVALSIFSATLGTALLSFGLPVTAVGIMGIIIAGVIGAVIDDKFADEINNKIIPSAH